MTALTGEVGEAANIVKKLNRYRDEIKGNQLSESELKAEFRKELADVFIYLDLLCQAANIGLSDAILDKFNETSKKIGWIDIDAHICN